MVGVCYFCKKPGHQISDCFERQRSLKSQGSKKTADLISVEEENVATKEEVTDEQEEVGTEANACCTDNWLGHECCIQDNKVRLECGYELPLVSALCKDQNIK